jgi:hypothetical protein
MAVVELFTSAAVSFGWLSQRQEGSFRAPDPRVSRTYDERGRVGPEEVHTGDKGTLVRKIENGGSNGGRGPGMTRIMGKRRER